LWGLRGERTETSLVWRGITVRVVYKPNRHSYLRVRPPAADIEVSASQGMPISAIRALLDERAQWIDRQRSRILANGQIKLETFASAERVTIFGVVYPLRIVSDAESKGIRLADGEIQIRTTGQLRPDEGPRLLQGFYRERLAQSLAPLLQKYQNRLGLTEVHWRIRSMKTRWGSCSTRTRSISLNLELIHHPQFCLEYVVVHELVHFYERYHNARFYSLVESLLPRWREAHHRLRHSNRA